MSIRLPHALVLTALAVTLLSGCNGSDSARVDTNTLPSFVAGAVTKTMYDGVTDDLLTGGLGKTGLQSATPPAIASAAQPTAAELRKLAIYNNYRALLDPVPAGGYGTLYGPNLDASGGNTRGEGKVAGTEYLAYADDGTGAKNVTMMVQVPSSFDQTRPCIVTAASSGSRGVYGAIGTAGEWGLKRGCAVAYTDKGTGTGLHELTSNTVNLQSGLREDAAAAGKRSNFTANLTDAQRSAFLAARPNRVAVKQVHSQQNPEKDWGIDTLNAVRFAFYVLNEQFAARNPDGNAQLAYKPDNTIVIAASVSNGGGSSLAAAEQDTEGLIDGVAVGEPQIQLVPNANLAVTRGTQSLTGTGRTLYDYFSLANLFQPCASLSTRAADSPGLAFVPAAIATNRCSALKARGLLTAATTSAQAEESMDMLLAAGWQPETAVLQASHYAFAVPPVLVAYANAYGRFGVADSLCGFSYAPFGADNKPAPFPAAGLAQYFGTANGVPPSGAVAIINDNAVGGPTRDPVSVTPSTGALDFNIDGAICLRNLWTGSDANAARVHAGVNETLHTANLHGKPAIIVHGRNDTLVPPAFTSRPYFGQNRITEGANSKLSYIEVTNAQHFDAFIDSPLLPGYDSRLVPLHYYVIQALDRMYAHLTQGAPLPPSQVVRTTPRGGTPGAAPSITTANVPPIADAPASGDLITFSGNTVTIPD
jgi:hydroxybutyrate-dimer hydrolase